LNKKILILLLASIILSGISRYFYNTEFNKNLFEQKITKNPYQDAGRPQIPVEPSLSPNLNSYLPKFAIETTREMQENEDDFYAGLLTNLTVNTEGNLLLDKWDIDNWKDITTSGPSKRWGHAMAYDSKFNKIVLFGGRNDDWEFLYDTWVYDLETNTWAEIYIPEMYPDPRIHHTMVYSPAADLILLHGGLSQWEEALEDMWTFDLKTNEWAFLDFGPRRCGHTLVYDPFEENIILFGGYDPYYRTYFRDTWLLDWRGGHPADWYNITSSLDTLSPRAFYSMSCVYSNEDLKDRSLILFGGENDGNGFDDTWIYDFNHWTQISPSTSPSERLGHTMIYDNVTPQVVIFGGYSTETYEMCSDTWIFNLTTSSWTQKSPSEHPEGRYYHSMVHIPKANLSLIFGGYDPSEYPDIHFSDTWIYLTNNYYESGSFLSQITNFDHIYNIQGNMSWNIPNAPANTSLEIQIGFSNTTNDDNFRFWSINEPEDTFTGLAQYIRFQAQFKANLIQNSTPWLEWVNISCTLFRPVPFVEITNPLDDNQVTGAIFVSAKSESPNGIANISFLIDEVLQVTLLSEPYRFLWNSDTTVNKVITIPAVAITTLGQTNSHSVQVEVHNQVNTYPSSPQNLSAITGQNNISLMWDPPLDTGGTEIVQYNIYRGTTSTEYLFLGLTTLITFTDIMVSTGITYHYAVTAENSVGESGFSTPVSIAITDVSATVPDTPSDLSASTGYNYVELNWNVPEKNGGSPLIGYRVYRGIQSGDYNVIFLSTTPNYNDTLVKAGSTYYYVITAENDVGESLVSEEIIITTSDPPSTLTIPNPPSSLTTNAGENYVEISWNAPENDGGSPITSYRVYRGTQTGEYSLIFITTRTTYNDTLILGETTYYYVITAVNALGESYYSQEEEATPTGVSIPKSGAFPDILSIIAILVVGVVLIRKKRQKS